MRIAVVTWTRRQVGGVQAYLATVVPALCDAGHAIALVSEADSPLDRDQIAPEVGESWCVATVGTQMVVDAVKQWQPDLLFAHGSMDPAFEDRLLDIAPGVLFAHGYYGTCISGVKCFSAPVPKACERRFGWPCLIHYYPHRCGGLSPITMAKNYKRQADQLVVLKRYTAIVTHSHWMAEEYLRHGIPRQAVHCVPLCVGGNAPVEEASSNRNESSDHRYRLLFLGRMDPLKGGLVLLRSLPILRGILGCDLLVRFAGDGPQRSAWEREALRIKSSYVGLDVRFTGWVTPSERDAILDETDLLILPSIFPEPFGLVGIEAGWRGVPTAAFAMGGITDWLKDGVNGFLAPADPPTERGLANAAAKCLSDAETRLRLRRGALEVAKRHSLARHLESLGPILSSASRSPGATELSSP